MAAGESMPVVGVIGAGNMGSALVQGWLRAGADGPRLVVWDKVEELAGRLAVASSASSTGYVFVRAAASLDDLVEYCEVIFIVVKPKDASELLGALAGRLAGDRTVVSTMAGLSLAWIRNVLGRGPSLFRMMPNLAVRLGAGVLAVSPEPGTLEGRIRQVIELLRPLGVVETVPEDQLDVVTALSGSGPGFLAVTMEALEDGAVAAGLSREFARVLVREAAKELSRRLSEQGDSVAAVRSILAPAGSPAAQGVELLEQREMREAFAGAVTAALQRSRSLGGGR